MKTKIIYFSVLLILFSSCGTSLIKLSDNSRIYSVYIDNQYKGLSNSNIRIPRSGLPQKKLIEIKNTRGQVIAHEKIIRDFNAVKFLVGFFYLYPIWFFSWEYDKKIEIYIDNSKINKATSPWDDEPKDSPWD